MGFSFTPEQESNLVLSARAGNADAANTVVCSFYTPIKNYFFRKTLGIEIMGLDHEDLASHSLILGLKKFEPNRGMRFLNYCIMIGNSAYNHKYIQWTHQHAALQAMAKKCDRYVVMTSPEEVREAWSVIRHRMIAESHCPAKIRQICDVFEDVQLRGMTYETAAEICGENMNTIKSRMRRFMQSLQEYLKNADLRDIDPSATHVCLSRVRAR